jgi:DNA primase
MSVCRELYDKPTLAEVRDVLMQNGKKIGANWVFQCPICQDESCDNLVFEKNANYIKCFSCVNNEGGKYVLTEITRKRGEKEREEQQNIKVNTIKKFEKESVQEEYWEKLCACNQYLLGNQKLLDLLYDKRGIDKQTVTDCDIGFDKEKEEWTIPLISLSYCKLMGFEYRRKNFDLYPAWKEGDKQSKVRRDSGYVSDVCVVYDSGQKEILYIMEGFWDSYCIHQYLRNKGQINYAVYSCSNGVSSLLNVLNRVDFSNFKKVKLILDADKAGTEVTEKIIEKYPFIKDCRKFLFDSGVKDMNEWLLTQIGGKNGK